SARVVSSLDDVTDAYRWADVAIACAGAVTLAELAGVALPALLVPLATAALDHQRANARAFRAATRTSGASEDAWDGAEVQEGLAAVVASRDERRTAGARIAAAARPEAAADVVAACESLLRSGARRA